MSVSYRRLLKSSWLLIAVALHACTCSSSRGPQDPAKPGESGSNAGAGGLAGGSNAGQSGSGGQVGQDGGGAEYEVELQATATRLCPGQCTELVATVANGREPHTFAWNQGLEDSAGPHEICPERSTTYTVTATDTATEGEFGRPSQAASAEIEIEVADADDDACAVDGGFIDPPSKSRELCSIAIGFDLANPAVKPNFGTALSTDELGNLYVVGWYEGMLDLGGAVLWAEGGGRDGYAAKYDADCQLVWSKRIGRNADVFINGGDVGPSELVLVGSVRGTLAIDGVVIADSYVDDALLVQLDRESGALTRAVVYEDTNAVPQLVDVGIDALGDIVFVGSNGDLFIEGVPVFASQHMFIAKITAAGEHVFSYPIAGTSFSGRIAVHPDGHIALTASAEGSAQLGDSSIPIQGMGHRRFVAAIEPDGQVSSGRELDMDIAAGAQGYFSNAIAIDADHNIVVEHHNYVLDDDGLELPEQLTKLDATGGLLWSREVSSSEEHWIAGAKGAIAFDSHGNILHTDELEVGTIEPVDSDVIVRKLTPDGTLIWEHTLATAKREATWGIAVSPDDSIWVAHGDDARVYQQDGTLRITKLAP